MENALNAAARNFGRVFERQMLWCNSLDELLGSPAESIEAQAVR